MERAHSDFLFVYSSLRMGFQSEKYEYIRRYFSFEGNAKVKGLLSDLGNYPVATPTDENYFLSQELILLIPLQCQKRNHVAPRFFPALLSQSIKETTSVFG